MLFKIFLALAVLVAVFAAVVAMQPSTGTVARSATIAAPPAAVFAQVNDLHKWQAWSPWAKIDPNAKSTFEGPDAGVGAAFSWDGNSQVGAGKMTIIESRPNDLVRMRLDFLKPFASTSVATFTFTPNGTQTAMTWSMTGERPFMARAVCFVMDMDKMVGGQFEAGLANLKSIAEKPV